MHTRQPHGCDSQACYIHIQNHRLHSSQRPGNRDGVLHDLETSSGGRVIQALIRVVLRKRARQILVRLALEVEESAKDLVVIVLDGFGALLDGLFGHEDI